MDVRIHPHSSMCNICECHMIVKCHSSIWTDVHSFILQGYSSIHDWKNDIHWFIIHDVQTQSKTTHNHSHILPYYMFNIMHFMNTISLGFDGCHPKQSRPSPHGTKSTLTYDFGGEPYESAFSKDNPCTSLVIKHYTLQHYVSQH
jgi:hypothetical protein